MTLVTAESPRVSPHGRYRWADKRVRSAPDIEMHGEELSQGDESMLYHYFELNYIPIGTESGRRLARR